MEVLVALAVLSLVLGAIIKSVSATTQNETYLRDKTFAHWVAMNQIAEVQARRLYPSLGTDSGKEELGNHEWHWKMTVSDAGTPGLRQLLIEVRRDKNDKQVLASLIALVNESQ